MAVHSGFKSMRTAKEFAEEKREEGFHASVYKAKNKPRVSVSRK